MLCQKGPGEHGGKPPYPDTRMAERRGLPVRHAPPTFPSSSHLAPGQRANATGYHGAAPHTPTLEWQNGEACQLGTRRRKPACQTAHTFPLRRKAALEWMNGGICPCHPIDRKAGLAISARTVGRRFAREDMLSHRLPATFILEWQNGGAYQPGTRRRQFLLPATPRSAKGQRALGYHGAAPHTPTLEW